MLAIARALMTNPALLLLDEPLEGLAPIIVEELAAAIRRIGAEDGTAFILVEQHAEIALALTETRSSWSAAGSCTAVPRGRSWTTRRRWTGWSGCGSAATGAGRRPPDRRLALQPHVPEEGAVPVGVPGDALLLDAKREEVAELHDRDLVPEPALDLFPDRLAPGEVRLAGQP